MHVFLLCGHACRYAYSATPTISAVAPASGIPGMAINVTGTGLADATVIRFFSQLSSATSSNSSSPSNAIVFGGSGRGTAMQLAGACNISAAAYGWAACAAVPSLPATGIYWLVLARDNGEQSVDALKVSGVQMVQMRTHVERVHDMATHVHYTNHRHLMWAILHAAGTHKNRVCTQQERWEHAGQCYALRQPRQPYAWRSTVCTDDWSRHFCMRPVRCPPAAPAYELDVLHGHKAVGTKEASSQSPYLPLNLLGFNVG